MRNEDWTYVILSALCSYSFMSKCTLLVTRGKSRMLSCKNTFFPLKREESCLLQHMGLHSNGALVRKREISLCLPMASSMSSSPRCCNWQYKHRAREYGCCYLPAKQQQKDLWDPTLSPQFAQAVWLICTWWGKFDTFWFLEECLSEQWTRRGEAGNLAPFKGALIISCTKSKSPQVSHIVTWSMHCSRPTFIAQLLGVKCFTCLWGHVKGELPPVCY